MVDANAFPLNRNTRNDHNAAISFGSLVNLFPSSSSAFKDFRFPIEDGSVSSMLSRQFTVRSDVSNPSSSGRDVRRLSLTFNRSNPVINLMLEGSSARLLCCMSSTRSLCSIPVGSVITLPKLDVKRTAIRRRAMLANADGLSCRETNASIPIIKSATHSLVALPARCSSSSTSTL